ncbi:MAG: hypothetical protein OSB41_05065 [Kiritimatiellae bacterium]|nr:hypothetical protein [Kiritimatiellia bacterium]
MKNKAIFAAGLMVAFALLTPEDVQAQASGYLVMNDSAGTQVRGKIIWRGGSRAYEVRDPNNASISRSVPFDRVRSVHVKKPAGLDVGVKAVSGGSFSGAHIAKLEAIVKAYGMLGHDLTAGAALARAYVETGQGPKTEDLYRRLKSSRKAGDLPGGLVGAYWDALLKAGKSSVLNREIDIILRTGARSAVAVAYVLKGDIKKQDGKFEDALIDGYLRTVVLYRDIKDVQPEALYKAHSCFQELNQVTHAETMRKRLMEAYPTSSYAKDLKAGK